MPIASFSGLASGVQWGDIVDQIMAAEKARRLTPVQQSATTEQRRIDALGTYRGLVDTLRDAADKLKGGTALTRLAVTVPASPSTGRSLFTATAGSTAAPGTYDVTVGALARAHSMAGAARGSDTAALGLEGDFTVNGRTITVAADDSLAAVRDAINAADAGVSASVLKESDGSYRLTLTSRTAGAAGISYADGAGGVGAALGIATTVSGQDAQVTINGVTISRATNTITDAVPGLTLNLQSAEPASTVQLTVERDKSAITADVKALVDAYNKVRGYVDAQGSSSPLARAPILRSSLWSFKQVVFDEVADPSSTPYGRLSVVGVAFDRNGQLQVDESRLAEVVDAGMADLNTLLADVGSRMAAAAENVTRDETGTLATQIRSHQRLKSSYEARALDIQGRLDLAEQRMLAEFTRMEAAMAQVQSQGSWLSSQVASLPTYK
jgi:flagellar hook-associated protein 2